MRGFIIAATFLTRLPFPAPTDVSQEEFTASQRYYPIVGLLLGVILSLSALLLLNFYPPLVVATALIIEELILTGGIHMDGFMDSMDALWSARTPEKMLEIMKDSRVGSFGALSASALLLLKFTLVAGLLQESVPLVSFSTHFAPILTLLIMPILSRWVFMFGILFYPYAREEGLGQGFHESSLQKPLFFTIEGLICLALTVYLLGLAGLIGFLFSILFIYYFSKKVARLLGGLTGDLYGASIELSEILFLIGVIPFFR
ncbi:adenosylcobinamide-GDP ribazoletransferase [Desulfitobacterium metallireducens]|uniref:Adenosylcobinamide-GDP ribazoletransferase n=1 Tax=Desulfitobacterium metallireducens DSM 15288 TaxID=871968 RepID=W0ED81_9FIRM|nr:adenosylcobinamide-GDP ribazoletransferase [Desulfitobacterium metallireducens]AHF07149.1 cobalamin synthase [Desulfitobacterium metallireducens DSM 15288]